jgi:hypothetical protein
VSFVQNGPGGRLVCFGSNRNGSERQDDASSLLSLRQAMLSAPPMNQKPQLLLGWRPAMLLSIVSSASSLRLPRSDLSGPNSADLNEF